MLGLIKKDLLMIKSNLKLVIVMFVVLFIFSLQGGLDMSFLPAMICIMIFMSTFSYDEYNKWDAYAITLPNGRKNIAKSKYIATLILIILSIIITIILNIIIGYIKDNINYQEIFSLMAGCAFGIIIIESILYPLIFKFGIEKGRIGLFVGVFGITMIIGLLSQVINIDKPLNLISFIDNYWLIIVPVLSAIILIISYKISERIYLKKEF